MRRLSLLAITAVCIAAIASAQTPTLTGANGKTLQQLAGSDVLVTAVINGSNAEDTNLRVLEIGPDYIAVQTDNNERQTYLFKSLAEIRVQEGRIEKPDRQPAPGINLLPEQQQIVKRALERASAIFDAGDASQNYKLDAAAILGVGGEVAAKDKASEYILKIRDSNDLASGIAACMELYLMGRVEDIKPEVLDAGLASGNRVIRSESAKLAGLIQYKKGEPDLLEMFRDRRPDISSSAARALARLGDKEIVADLILMLDDRNTDKGEAAIFALSKLLSGDKANTQLMKDQLADASSTTRFRLGRVLYKLDDPDGRKIITEEIIPIPTLQTDAAMFLAKDGDLKSMDILRERRDQRIDEVESAQTQLVELAVALRMGGDRTAIPVLQNALRSDKFPPVQERVCELITEMGIKDLTVLIQPALESQNTGVSVRACQAAVSSAYAQFRERLVDMWQ